MLFEPSEAVIVVFGVKVVLDPPFREYVQVEIVSSAVTLRVLAVEV